MMSGENKVSWTVKDLIPNGEYYFRVQAVNKIGGGEFVELRNPVIAEDQKRMKRNYLVIHKSSILMFKAWSISECSCVEVTICSNVENLGSRVFEVLSIRSSSIAYLWLGHRNLRSRRETQTFLPGDTLKLLLKDAKAIPCQTGNIVSPGHSREISSLWEMPRKPPKHKELIEVLNI